MFKKIIAGFMIATLSLGCISCGNNNDGSNVGETEVITDTTQTGEDSQEEIENLISNGDFSEGLSGWGSVAENGGALDFSEQNATAVVQISNGGLVETDVAIYYDGFELVRNGVYELSFDLNSDLKRKIDVRVQQNGGNNRQYYDKHLDVKEGNKHYSFKFSMKSKSDSAPRLYFNLGTPDADTNISANNIKIDNVSLVLQEMRDIIDESVNETTTDKEQKEIMITMNGASINLNQVGFLTNARKTCVVRAENIEDSFSIIDSTGKEVYKGKLTGPVDATYAQEKVLQGDFSDFTVPGKYSVKISNGDVSGSFEIGDNVYDKLLKDALLMLTIQRCGIETTSDYAGGTAHPACHTSEAVIYGTDIKKDVSGGWHDAGDYGRYIVAAATTVDDLFLTYEDYPRLWASDNLGIPESGNGVPDILDEAKYELDWMLKMQDEKTGGVYHKVTCYSFPGFVMPQAETEELVISPISNTATGDFAAVMAKASVLYKDYYPEFSAKALESAKKAYLYLEEHMDAKGYKNPDEITTGEYGDSSFEDEMYWASVELFKCTGEAKYKEYFESSISKSVTHGFGWDAMGTYGNIAYLTMDEKDQNPELSKKLTDSIVGAATTYLENSKSDGYMVALGSNYCWGSNLSVCAYARQMILASKYSNTEEFNKAAYDQISYLLGQNATGYSFVTGYGTLSPVNPHHRLSYASGSLVRGMVVGGPNSGLQDDYVKKLYQGIPAAKVYADNLDSYSTNEITIYWNSPFVYLLSAIISQNQ